MDENNRKEIQDFRKKRREERLNPKPEETDPEKIRIKKLVDEYMDKAVPSMKKYNKSLEQAADSDWFAWSEMERFMKHVKDEHGDDAKKCGQSKCVEQFPMEDFKEFAKTLTDSAIKYLESSK